MSFSETFSQHHRHCDEAFARTEESAHAARGAVLATAHLQAQPVRRHHHA
jgi:hypothetical protein